jgi:hypothetical protein
MENYEDFEDWLENLETQTLTDELKREILERVRDLHEDAYGLGYAEANHEIIDLLTSRL